MEEDQQFCLRWNNHQSTLISVFDTLLENGTLVDCTLAAEGKFLKAHKVVLSACSPYFATLLSQQYDKHPIFILKDVKFQELRAMMDYMYRGEVNISQDQLGALLKAAESLQIKGLSDNRTNNNSTQKNETKQPEPASKSGLTIEQKRPRNSAIDIDSDIAGSREGSTSPTSRKRKKVRRRSNEALIDNHDHLSNSSSQSLPHAASTSGSANLATSVVNVTKKTEILQQQIENKGIATGIVHVMSENLEDPGNNQTMNDDEDDGDDDCDNEVEAAHNKKDLDLAHAKNKSTNAEMLLEPKNEYDDGHDENVEDLTLEDEDLLEDMEHPGPSHGGEGSSHGYSQWQVERSQDESFMTTQESVTGQHRDAQAFTKKKINQSTSTGIDMIVGTPIEYKITMQQQNMSLPTVKQLLKTSLKREQCNISMNQIIVPTQSPVSISSLNIIGSPKDSYSKSTKNHPRIKYSKHKNPTLPLTISSQQHPLLLQMNQSTPIITKTFTIPPGEIDCFPGKIQSKFLIQQKSSNSDQYNINDDLHSSIITDLENYAEIDDIELPDGSQIRFEDDEEFSQQHSKNSSASMDEKYMKYDYHSDSATSAGPDDGTRQYCCGQCGKRYRWKSTLRRHENVECGGKEPVHQCPHCAYKAKQRGNLGVHIRKHHTQMPPLESRRKPNANKTQ